MWLYVQAVAQGPHTRACDINLMYTAVITCMLACERISVHTAVLGNDEEVPTYCSIYVVS